MADTNLQFRAATTDDAELIKDLVESAFRAKDSRDQWTGSMDLASTFSIDLGGIINKIHEPDSVILIVTESNRPRSPPVASITASKVGEDYARLALLAVDQHHNRRGIGRKVLAYAEEYCYRTWGVKKLGLNALCTREELISWYIRRGYRKTGELSPFPMEALEGRSVDIPEGLELNFVELEKIWSPPL